MSAVIKNYPNTGGPLNSKNGIVAGGILLL